MFKIFITGGNGYVGRNLAQYFAGKGHSVVALIRNSNIKIEKLKHPNIQIVLGDIQKDNLLGLMSGCNILIHTAADVDHTNKSKTQYLTNVDGTKKLLIAAKKAKVSKFIHLSTESVLATGVDLINVNETQNIPKVAVGNYSDSKAMAEKVVLSFASSEFSVSIIRPRMVWGRDDTTALPQIVNAVQNGKFAWIEGGHYLTSTTHIENLCYGIERVIQAGRNSEIYAITDGEPIEFRAFVTMLLATQKIDAPVKEIPRKILKIIARSCDFLSKVSFGFFHGPITYQQYAASAVEITLDIHKAVSELDYYPIISRKEGLEELQLMS